MPQGRQIFLSVITFGSVAWLIVLLGVVFPNVGTFLLAFATLPSWVDKTWVRLAMLAAAIVIPLIIGFVSLFLLDPEDRPEGGAARAKTVAKGYLFTFGLAVTLIMMTIFAPLMKLGPMLKRWATQHIPMIVESNDYLGIVGEVQQALKVAGWDTARHQASWMMRFPTKLLTAVSGGTIQNLVADQLTVLKAKDLEVTLHPSDLIMSGTEQSVIHARAVVAEQLAFSKAYMTWTKEANQVEDYLSATWRELKLKGKGYATGDAARRLQDTEDCLRTLKVPYEEWEVLMRKKLLVERGALQVAAGVVDHPTDLTDGEMQDSGAARLEKAKPLPQRLFPRAAALAAIGLFTWSRLKSDRAEE